MPRISDAAWAHGEHFAPEQHQEQDAGHQQRRDRPAHQPGGQEHRGHQVEQRLEAWFAGVERYPRQLHEIERAEYLAMKRREIQRQQMPVASATAP